jgi:hypothetical protein
MPQQSRCLPPKHQSDANAQSHTTQHQNASHNLSKLPCPAATHLLRTLTAPDPLTPGSERWSQWQSRCTHTQRGQGGKVDDTLGIAPHTGADTGCIVAQQPAPYPALPALATHPGTPPACRT